MSFDDEESFKEAVESLHFNNPASDSSEQQMGSSDSMPLEDSERNEDRYNITPRDSDPITLRRVGSSSNLSIRETRRSGDVQDSLNNPPLESNP